jgi:hypothetical protein
MVLTYRYLAKFSVCFVLVFIMFTLKLGFIGNKIELQHATVCRF